MMKTPAGAIALLATLSLVGCEEDPYQTEDDGSATGAAVRVVNKVSDVPSIDFCVKGAGGWLGPVMNQLLQKPDGLPTSEETGYMPLAAGAYTARLVDPAFNLCTPSWNSEDQPMDVQEGLSYTAEITGTVDPADDTPVVLVVHQD
jgi:hypothetical protein